MASPGGPQIKREIYHEDKVTTLDEAGENLRRTARNPWTVLKENRRALAVILAIQVRALRPALITTGRMC